MDPNQPPALRNIVPEKPKYGQPRFRVATQFRNTGGSSSPIFPIQASATQFSRGASSTGYGAFQSTPPASAPVSKTPARAGPHTFVLNTVDSMKNGHRPILKRSASQAGLSDNSSLESTRSKEKVPKPTRLRPSRPVQNSNQVYSDVWINILSFSEPKLLLEVKTINKHFYHLLQENSAIWRESRLNHYGSGMPACPKGLTEHYYVELLAGRGCQSTSCPTSKTQKVHWMFQVRLCPRCLAEKTMRVCRSPASLRHLTPY